MLVDRQRAGLRVRPGAHARSIDVVVVFLFTKPMVTMLARTQVLRSGAPVVGPRCRAGSARRGGRSDAADDPVAPRPTGRPDVPRPRISAHQLYRGEVSYDFVGRPSVWYSSPPSCSCLARCSLSVRGLNLGIEFRGGAEFRVTPPARRTRTVRAPSRTASAVEHVVTAASAPTHPGADGDADHRELDEVRHALAEALRGPARRGEPAVHRPDLGCGDLDRRRCRRWASSWSVIVFISLYFEWRMAVAAIVALLHDLVITVGRLRARRVRGDAGDGHRVADDPRLLALRHRRRVRQGAGEHPGRHGGSRHHVRRGGQPRGQPDPGAVDQHLGRSALLPVGAMLFVGVCCSARDR